MRARVAIIFALLAAAWALAPFPVASADSAVNTAAGLSMDVRVGYGNAARPGTWVPVQVDVSNEGSDLVGRLEVQFETAAQQVFFGPPPAVYSTPAMFPQHSHKRLTIDVPVPPALHTDRVQVRLIAGNQTLLQRAQPFDPATSGTLVCGVLNQTLGAYDFLTSLDLPGRQQRARVADLTVGNVPNQAALLSSLDCLIVGDVNLAPLTTGQVRALTGWVAAGGLLVVTGGVNWQQSVPALPPALLPVRVAGLAARSSIAPLDRLAHVNAASVGPWTVTQATPVDGTVVAGDATGPLLTVRRFGSGSAFFLALDPSQEPARSWAGNRFLWSYLLGFAGTPAASGRYDQSLATWGSTPLTALSSLPNLNPAVPVWMFLFLGLYGVVLGPGMYALLSRIDRREWLIVVLPLAGLIGTAATVRLAQQYQGADIAATEVTLIDQAAGPIAQSRTYIGLYTPRPATIDLHTPTDTLVAPAQRSFARLGESTGAGRAPLQISQGLDVFVPALKLVPGTLSTFSIETQTSVGAGLTGSVTVDGSLIHGQVVNQTGQRIADAALIVGNTVFPLGTLQPNSSRAVTFTSKSPGTDSAGTSDSLAARLYPPAPGGLRSTTNARRDILDRLFSSSSFYGGQTQGGSFVIGWLDQSPIRFSVHGARVATRAMTLLEAQMPLTINPATVRTISDNLISERSLVTLGVTQAQPDHYSITTGGSFGIEYDLPVTSRFLVQTLHLQVQANYNGGTGLAAGTSLGAISAFNWGLNAWQDLPLVNGTNNYASAGDLVSPIGQVRLHYSFKAPLNSGATGIDISHFSLSASGQAT